MNRSRNAVAFLILIILVFVELTSMLNLSLAEESLSLRLSFDQPYYTARQKFGAIITVSNSSDKKLSKVGIKFYVGEKLDLEKERSFPTEQPKKPRYTYSWSRTLKPGETKLKTSKSISSAKLTEGTYPAWVVVTRNNKIITKKLSALVVVEEKTAPPLAVALLWNLHDRAHFNGDGVFVDDWIQKDCFINSNHAGIYSTHLSSLTTHPNFKISMNFTPLLLQQIKDISGGYKLKKDDGTVRIPKDAKDALNAQQILSGYGRLAKNGQIEMVPAPFAYPSLSYLAYQGWENDAAAQIEKGKKITKELLGLPEEPAGTYLPELKVTSKSLSYMAKTKSKYTILDESYSKSLPKDTRNIYRPYRVQDGQDNRTTIFFSDNFASSILSDTSDPEATVQLLLGVLAEVYLRQPEQQKVIVIAPGPEVFKPSGEFLEALYTRIEQIPWLKSTNFTTALQLVPPDNKPITLAKEAMEEPVTVNKYSNELGRTRNMIKHFGDMTLKTHPLENKLSDYLLIAEARDFLVSKDPEKENLGFDFMQEIKDQIAAELNKIDMPQNQTITLTSSKGKIPIAINNKTLSSFKITITARSKGLLFPDGNSKVITLHPGENLFTLPVITKTSSPQQVKVALRHQDYVIKEGAVTVKSMYYSITILVILGLLIAAVVLPLTWRYFKSK